MKLQTFLRHFKRVERRTVTKSAFEQAVEQILLSSQGKVRSENREPKKADIQQGWAAGQAARIKRRADLTT